MKILQHIVLATCCLSSVSFANFIMCSGSPGTTASLSLDLYTMNASFQMTRPGHSQQFYNLEFEAVGGEHEPPSCTNPGPFLEYKTINPVEGMEAEIWIHGGYATIMKAEIVFPGLSEPISLYCSYRRAE